MYLYRAYFKRLIKKINAILYREIVNNRFISLFIHTNIFSSFVHKIKNLNAQNTARYSNCGKKRKKTFKQQFFNSILHYNNHIKK